MRTCRSHLEVEGSKNVIHVVSSGVRGQTAKTKGSIVRVQNPPKRAQGKTQSSRDAEEQLEPVQNFPSPNRQHYRQR